jgi:hypothetical protein
MTVEDAGHRSPDGAYEWSAGIVEGKPLMIRHFAPDATSDLYSPGQINEPQISGRCGPPGVKSPGSR